MAKRKMTPAEALKLALEDENYHHVHTYDLVRSAAFLAALVSAVTAEIKRRSDSGLAGEPG